jgi:hypothetical protein
VLCLLLLLLCLWLLLLGSTVRNRHTLQLLYNGTNRLLMRAHPRWRLPDDLHMILWQNPSQRSKHQFCIFFRPQVGIDRVESIHVFILVCRVVSW